MKLQDSIDKFKKWPLTAQMITIIIPIFCVLILISVILFGPTFSFVEHHMSTLGTQSRNPRGFLFFNIACMIMGVLLYPFFYGIKEWRTDSKICNFFLYIFIGLGFIASFGIFMLAIFHGDYKPWHVIFSAVHWVSDVFFLAIAPIPLLKNEKYYRSITIICVIATIFNFIYLITAAVHPWIEWVTAATTLAFGALLGRNMVKEEFPSAFKNR